MLPNFISLETSPLVKISEEQSAGLKVKLKPLIGCSGQMKCQVTILKLPGLVPVIDVHVVFQETSTLLGNASKSSWCSGVNQLYPVPYVIFVITSAERE